MLVSFYPSTEFPTPLSSGSLSGFERQRLHDYDSLKIHVVGRSIELKFLAYVSCGHLAGGFELQLSKNPLINSQVVCYR